MKRHTLMRQLKKICRDAEIHLPPKAGYHWFRRRVATTIRKVTGSDIDAHSFMRWAEPKQFAMLARYDQTPHQETDKSILEHHPFVTMWEEVAPYLFKHNSSYNSLFCNRCYG
jgi:hypothetical protein